jgi:hypothetical protein
MAEDLSTEFDVNSKLEQVFKEAFAIYYLNGECSL